MPGGTRVSFKFRAPFSSHLNNHTNPGPNQTPPPPLLSHLCVLDLGPPLLKMWPIRLFQQCSPTAQSGNHADGRMSCSWMSLTRPHIFVSCFCATHCTTVRNSLRGRALVCSDINLHLLLLRASCWFLKLIASLLGETSSLRPNMHIPSHHHGPFPHLAKQL